MLRKILVSEDLLMFQAETCNLAKMTTKTKTSFGQMFCVQLLQEAPYSSKPPEVGHDLKP